MQYPKTVTGIFISRPNRFTAIVAIEGREEICHVKNTGRCRELLIPGCRVILSDSQYAASPSSRKTRYDLVAVYKDSLLINMDSQAPNAAAREWLEAGGLFTLEAGLGSRLVSLRPETVFGDSRFDFFLKTDTCEMFLEVKGVTLEEQGVLKFPDAPTKRGEKHIRELTKCVRAGYRAGILFVIQMEQALYFTPNTATHPAFAQALTQAEQEGVMLFAMNCLVTPDSMKISSPVPICL